MDQPVTSLNATMEGAPMHAKPGLSGPRQTVISQQSHAWRPSAASRLSSILMPAGTSRPTTASRLLMALPVLALLCAAFAQPAGAVPFRPDVVASLRAQGQLEAIVAATDEARSRGLDQPPAVKHPWLETMAAQKARIIPDRQAIVILVDFSDNPADVGTYPPSHYEAMLFSAGTYPTGSMRDWYLENSYGQFNVTGAVTVWLRMPHTYTYYVNGQAGFGSYPNNAQKLAEDAVVAADPYVDFSQYDNDGPDGLPDSGDDDGIVDALFVVHAGPGREETGSDNDIHSHAWSMVTPQSVDGVIARGYSMEPEDGQRGVFGHEFGHVLGLPDLYDTDYSSSGAGYWCMMSTGSWGGGGLTPVHFLSWCKAHLGFLEPTVPLTNQAAATLPQVETNPSAYVLWTGGYPGQQYFTVENRQRVGSDVSLPGAGLIICHVDETVSGNSDDWHPLLMVEQADGLSELQGGGASDAGDPYPGTTGNRTFDSSSVPNSRDYLNVLTQVAVANISDSDALMTADLTVEDRPIFRVTDQRIVAFDGNADGDIDPGEDWQMVVTVKNIGFPATNVTGTATSSSPYVTILNGTTALGDLGAEEEGTGTPPLGFSLAGGSTVDAVPIQVAVSDPAGDNTSVSLVAGVNDALQVFGWQHEAVRSGYLDQWLISTQRNHTTGGSYSWKCGAKSAGDYANHDDAALVTIAIPLEYVTAIRFWHWIDAEDDVDWTAWDGGIIEASIDDGPWAQITPDGGYPYTIIANPESPFPAGTPCFSGTYTWSQVRVDLSGLDGNNVRLRFRFGTDGAVTEEGWYIDDVTFEGLAPMALEPDVDDPAGADPAAVTQVWLSPARPNPSPGSVALDYRLPAGTPARLTILDAAGRVVTSRGIAPANGTNATLTWDGRFADGRSVPGGLYLIRLEWDGGRGIQKAVLLR
jgi:immune inhibitor A